MARATHLTIGTADRIRLDALHHDGDDHDREGENEVRQEVQISITYVLDPGDTDLTALAEEKAGEVQRAHEAAWNRIGALGSYSQSCTCRHGNYGEDDGGEDEGDGHDAQDSDMLPARPLPISPFLGGMARPLPTASVGQRPDPEPGEDPITGPQKILIRSQAKKIGLTSYALERLLHEQFKVWQVERLSKGQAASLLDALNRDLKEREAEAKEIKDREIKERDQHEKNGTRGFNGTQGLPVAVHGRGHVA